MMTRNLISFLLIQIIIINTIYTEAAVYKFTKGTDFSSNPPKEKNGEIAIKYFKKIFSDDENTTFADITIEFEEKFFKPNKIFKANGVRVNSGENCKRELSHLNIDFFTSSSSLIIKKILTTQVEFEKDNLNWCEKEDEFLRKGIEVKKILKANSKNLESSWHGIWLNYWILIILIALTSILKIYLFSIISKFENQSIVPLGSFKAAIYCFISVSVLLLFYYPLITTIVFSVSLLTEIVSHSVFICRSKKRTRFALFSLGGWDTQTAPLVLAFLVLISGIFLPPMVPYIVALTMFIPGYEQRKLVTPRKISVLAFDCCLLNFFLTWLIWYIPNDIYNPFFKAWHGVPPFILAIIGDITWRLAVKESLSGGGDNVNAIDGDRLSQNLPLKSD